MLLTVILFLVISISNTNAQDTSKLVTSELYSSVVLECNLTSITLSTSQLYWLVTQNKTGLFEIDNVNDKYSISNDWKLNITNLDFKDEEYYSCVYINANNELVVLSNYLIFVKQIPQIGIFLNENLIANKQLLNVSMGQIYSLACVSIDSRPNVTLKFYESNTGIEFETLESIRLLSSTPITNCNENLFCKTSLVYQFEIIDKAFGLNNLLCEASNSTYNIEARSEVLINLITTEDITANSTLVAAFIFESVLLKCDTSAVPLNSLVFWIVTLNKTNFGLIETVDNKYYVSSDALNITNLDLIDEEYYACVYNKTQEDYVIASEYFLFIKSNPNVGIFFNNNLVTSSNDTINVAKNTRYSIVCASVDSRPQVNLSFYESNSETPFEKLIGINILSNKTLNECDSNEYCKVSLIYEFEIVDDSFKNFENIICKAENTTNPFNILITESIKLNLIIEKNDTLVSAFIYDSIKLECSIPDGESGSLIWLISDNYTGLYEIQAVENKYEILSNGHLNLSNLVFDDEEYYYCGFLKQDQSFIFLRKYLLFVKVLPYIGLFFDKSQIANGSNVDVIKDKSYNLACISDLSRPNILLTIYDPLTNMNIDNLTSILIENKQFNENCTSDGYCNSVLVYQFRIIDDSFSSIASFVCKAQNQTEPFSMKIETSINFNLSQSTNTTTFTLTSGLLGDSVQLNCNLAKLPNNISYYWLSTENQTGFYQIEAVEGKYSIFENGSLSIESLDLNDEENYFCGYLTDNNEFIFLSEYFLFIKEKPILGMFFEKNLVNSGEQITVASNRSYNLACISKNSRPEVALKIIDSQTGKLFDDLIGLIIQLKQYSSNCDANSFCEASLIYQFQVLNSSISQIKALTCIAENITSPYELSTNTTINVNYEVDSLSVVTLATFLYDSILLKCDIQSLPLNSTFYWLSTENLKGFFEITPVDGKYALTENGSLNISNIDLNDEEYYYCGYLNTDGKFIFLTQYFLFVKEKPILGMFFEKNLVNGGEKIAVASNKSYNLACISKNSRPEVSLRIVNPQTGQSFEDLIGLNIQLKQYSSNCDANLFCEASLIYQFLVVNSSFSQIKRLSCIAENITNPYEISTNQTIGVFYESESYTSVASFEYDSILLSCDIQSLPLNSTYYWLSTENQTGLFVIESVEEKYTILEDGSLIILNVDLNDEEYYSCVYIEPNGDLKIISRYFLFIKALPSLNLFFNQIQLNESSIIRVDKNRSYSLACVGDYSRPEVNLRLYNTQTQTLFDDLSSVFIQSKQFTSNCDELSFCQSALIYQFIAIDNSFSSITSLTCEASNTTYPYNMSTSTNVSVEYTYEEPVKIQIVSEFVYSSIQLRCNLTGLPENVTFFWLTTENKTGLFEISDFEEKYSISTDGVLNISNLILDDEEFYSCGYFKTQNNFVLLSSYYLFVKVEPIVELILDNQIIDTTLSVILNKTYTLACISQGSRPEIELNLYDTQSKTNFESILSKSIIGKQVTSNCSSESLFCNAALIYQFLINDESFSQIKSLTCEALNNTVPYLMSTKREISVNFTILPVCAPNYCNSNGFCEIDRNNNMPKCVCFPGYLGEFCQVYDECSMFIFCQNNGTCFKKGNRYFCNCTGTGYTGSFCTIKLGSCKNGGTYDDRLKKCICPIGFSGDECTIRDPCSLGPCMNGGSCTSFENSNNYFCECPAEYTGKQCETQLCLDKDDALCNRLKNNCFTQYIGTIPVYEYCKRTCNQCSDELKDCFDTKNEKFCQDAKLNNFCPILGLYYPDYCRKTCGDC